MRIAMIGGGYVGLVSGACFADLGIEVAVVEVDPAKLAALSEGRIPIYEPGLDKLVADNVAAGRLSFGNDLAAAVQGAEAVFIAVGTPTRRGDGHADVGANLAAIAARVSGVAEAVLGEALLGNRVWGMEYWKFDRGVGSRIFRAPSKSIESGTR